MPVDLPRSDARRAGAYIVDRANGATMLEINLGRTVDALCWWLGEFRELTHT